MLDRRKIIIFSLIGILVIAVLVAVIVFVVTNQPTNDEAAPEATTSSAPTPSASPEDEAAEAIKTFKADYLDMARDAAVIASSWNGAIDPDVTKARYTQAGFSDELADTFTPVWAEVFGDNITAEITTTVDNNLTVDEARGDEGNYVWRIAAEVTFQGTWNENGAARAQAPRTATWWITIDQATETVTAIDQPTAEELQINVNEGE